LVFTRSVDELAEQQQALQTLHTLQQQHTTAWAAAFPMSNGPRDLCSQPPAAAGIEVELLDASDTAVAVPDGSGRQPGAVQVLQGGRGLHRLIQPGSRVKVTADCECIIVNL
jgi:hypothetical protein